MKHLLSALLLLASPAFAGDDGGDDPKKKTELSLPSDVVSEGKLVVEMPQRAHDLSPDQMLALAKSAAAVYDRLGRPRLPWQNRWYCTLAEGVAFTGPGNIEVEFCVKVEGREKEGKFELRSLEMREDVYQWGKRTATFGRCRISASGDIFYLGRKIYSGNWDKLLEEKQLVEIQIAFWSGRN